MAYRMKMVLTRLGMLKREVAPQGGLKQPQFWAGLACITAIEMTGSSVVQNTLSWLSYDAVQARR